MESTLVKFTAKKTIMRVCMIALITSTSLFPAHANTGKPPAKDSNITVNSLGMRNNGMYFNLMVDNENADKFSVTVSDDLGTILYKEIVSGKVIKKTFQTPSDLGTVYLTITNLSSKKWQKFEISPERRFVDDVAVTSVH